MNFVFLFLTRFFSTEKLSKSMQFPLILLNRNTPNTTIYGFSIIVSFSPLYTKNRQNTIYVQLPKRCKTIHHRALLPLLSVLSSLLLIPSPIILHRAILQNILHMKLKGFIFNTVFQIIPESNGKSSLVNLFLYGQ